MNAHRAMLLVAVAAFAHTMALAAPLTLPPAPRAQFTQNIGAALPLQQHFIDDDGAQVRLADLLDRHSALLLFGYYRCPMLCGVVAAGALEALRRSQLPDGTVRVVEISIDPHETPADATQKKADYVRSFGSLARGMHLLTGTPAAIDALAAAAGFHYSYDAAHAQYVHPAGFLLLTPQGRVSRYFFGVRFDAQELKTAIAQAGQEHTGSALARLLLTCAHYDPASGRYSVQVMMLVRVVCIVVSAWLAVWMWRRWHARRNEP